MFFSENVRSERLCQGVRDGVAALRIFQGSQRSAAPVRPVRATTKSPGPEATTRCIPSLCGKLQDGLPCNVRQIRVGAKRDCGRLPDKLFCAIH